MSKRIDRPIIFSGPMVRALIAGTKTQTRRLLYKKHSPKPSDRLWFDSKATMLVHKGKALDPGPPPKPGEEFPPFTVGTYWTLTPWRHQLKKGDRLWVRENFAPRIGDDGKPDPNPRYVKYAADGHASPQDPMDYHEWPVRWTPSIHMPRWASRLTLTVEAFRYERLQSISEEDARAEGPPHDILRRDLVPVPTKRMHFEHLWRSINGDESWTDNPWVAAVSFSVEKKNIDA